MSTRLMRRRVPLLPQPTFLSGAPATKGTSWGPWAVAGWCRGKRHTIPDNEHKGMAAGGRPGPAPKTKDSRSGRVRASEGTNPCTRPSFATKNVFDVLQDLSESIGGSPGPQLDAADGQPEPIVHDLHQSLIELLERPDILSLHAVRRVGRERQLHLKVRALCGEVEKVFDVLVDTGAQVNLVKACLLPPECLTDSRKPVRLKVANGQYMVGGTREAAIRFGPREAGDGEMRQGATGRRQGGDRKTTRWRHEDDRPAAGKRQGSDRKRQAGDRKATGEVRQEGDRRATGRRQGGDRETTGKRQEKDIATG